MKKGWLWIVVLGLIFAGISIIKRVQIEIADKGVQLVIDGEALQEFAKDKETLTELLKDLKDAKVDTLAIPEMRLWETAAFKEQAIYQGTYLLLLDSQGSFIDPRKLYIADDNGPIAKRLGPLGKKTKIDGREFWEFDSEYKVPVARRKEAVREPTTSIWEEAVRPDYNLLDLAKKQGLNLAFRIQNPYISTPENLEYLLRQWGDESSLIIFQGKEILGYPDHLSQAADLMSEKTWGFIEFANQYGEKEFARLTDYNLVRVHSITPGEMERIDPIKAKERYLRAARERGMRVLYLRPFPSLTVSENLTWFKTLAGDLEKEGFHIQTARPKPFFKSHGLIFGAVLFAIVICGIRLMLLLGFKEPTSLYAGILGLVLTAALYFKGYTILARQIAAFGTAVIFPTLALGSVIESIKDGKTNFLRLGALIIFYVSLGIIFLTSTLLDLRFMIKTEQFLGVKLMHILPPVLVLWIAYRYLGFSLGSLSGTGGALQKLKGIFWPPRLLHLLLLLFIAAGAFIYIGRTGHDWGLPVLKFEENLRVFLERTFLVRPRLKEAFIGQPALILGLLIAQSALIFNVFSVALPFLLTLGSIGVTSVLNTFTHAHTPLGVSFIRTVLGMGIGAILATVVFLLLLVFVRKNNRA